MTEKQPTANNVLKDIHSKLNVLPKQFKQRVMLECKWSPTYYYRTMTASQPLRKARKQSDLDPTKATPIMSNAEQEMVLKVLDELLEPFKTYCEELQKKRQPHCPFK